MEPEVRITGITSNLQSGPEDPEREGVSDELAAHSKMLDHLAAAVTQIEDRVNPVLRSRGADKEISMAREVSDASPVRARLMTQTDILASLTDRLHRLAELVDL